ncbi:MAG: hypothetical protein WB392_01635 [Methanotrichaceae archaeon]
MTQKVLLVDLCHEVDSLSKYEFVYPIADTLKRAGAQPKIVHFTVVSDDMLASSDKTILCGTALKDNTYVDYLESFSWIKQWERPVLGICAGMQVIGSIFGGRIIPRPAIGLEKINIILETPLLGKPREIEGYHLHNYGVTLPDEFQMVAGMPDSIDAFRHSTRPIYGIIFHPEVRNRWVLKKFIDFK